MKYSVAVLALLGVVSARHLHHKRNYLQFVDGNYDNTFDHEEIPQYVSRVNAKLDSEVPGVVLIGSDPIHGSLGPPKVPKEDLTPEQQFEQSLRNMKPLELKDD